MYIQVYVYLDGNAMVKAYTAWVFQNSEILPMQRPCKHLPDMCGYIGLGELTRPA